MKYMLQVRFNGADEMIHMLPADEQEKVTAEFIAIRESSGVLDGNQLQAANAKSRAADLLNLMGRLLMLYTDACDAGSCPASS